jgi:hypothetical protein
MSSIFEKTKYMYAERLRNKSVTLTIKSVVGGVEFTDTRGGKSEGFDIAFVETPKILGVTGITVIRQLALACGTDDPDQMVGKKITLYPVRSAKSISGQAIRIKTEMEHQ